MFFDFRYFADIQFAAVFCYEFNFNASAKILILLHPVVSAAKILMNKQFIPVLLAQG